MKQTLNNKYITEKDYLDYVDKLDTEMTAIYYILSSRVTTSKLEKAQKLVEITDSLADERERVVFLSGILSFYEAELLHLRKKSVDAHIFNLHLIEKLVDNGIPFTDSPVGPFADDGHANIS